MREIAMATATSDTTPYWSTSATFPQFAKLADKAEADVMVVGGGITGLTAAYLLARPANTSSSWSAVAAWGRTRDIPARM